MLKKQNLFAAPPSPGAYIGAERHKGGIEMDDQALIRALQAGERAALRRTMEVYAGYTSAVLGNTLRGQASREDLEELLSDVFLSLWRSREGLDPEKSLKSWLAAVARNRAVDFLRRKKETHPVPDGLPDPAPGPEEQAERREAEERLRALVEDMEEPDRTLFLRYYYEEEPLDQVCRDLKMRPSTARSRLCRGRRKLKERLTQEGGMLDAQSHP